MDKAKLAELRAKKLKQKAELESKRHQEILDSNKSVSDAFADLKELVLNDRKLSNEQLSKTLVELKQVANFTPAIEALEKALNAKIGDIAQAVSENTYDDSAVSEAISGLAQAYTDNSFDPNKLSQKPDDYLPFRRVIRIPSSGQYVFDDQPISSGNSFAIGGGGGSGGGGTFPEEVLRNGGTSIAIVNPDGTPIAIEIDSVTIDIGIVDNEIPGGAVDGANDTFTTFYDYKPGTTKVYLNGARQREGLGYDYAEMGGNDFQFAIAPLLGDTIIIDYMKA